VTDDDLEKRLRAGLRPVEPPPGFANRVMTRIGESEAQQSRRWRPARWRFGGVLPARWLPLSLAASVIIAVVLVHEHHKREEGLQARQQLIEALRVTGEKLDLAYRAVNAS
jgi:hypothetical protein